MKTIATQSMRQTLRGGGGYRNLRRTKPIQQPQPYRCLSCTYPQLQQEKEAVVQQEPTTHFGFQDVTESQKEAKVGAVFSSVASSYDTMNDLMSLGIHRLWKDEFVRLLNPGVKHGFSPPSTLRPNNNNNKDNDKKGGWSILDIAGGTGDIAIRLLDHATHINHDSATRVTVADINASMLAEGQRRAMSTPYYNTNDINHRHNNNNNNNNNNNATTPSRLNFIQANAEDLSGMIPSNSIDLYTVAFGIRNFTHKDVALREAYRVLKPGGVFACLEFSRVRSSLLDWAYRRWSFAVIPLIGQLVAADRDSYQYLVESIQRFPPQEEFSDMIAHAGFLIPAGGGWVDLSGGIAAIHRGVKPV